MRDPHSPEEDGRVERKPEFLQRPGKFLGQSAIFLFLGVGLFALVATVFFGEFLELAANWTLETLGISGILLITVLIDSVPSPFSFVPLLLLCLHHGMDPWAAGTLFSLASITGGVTGVHLGRWFGLPKRLSQGVEARYPGSLDWLRKNAALGVALFAVLPLPFSLATWSAGALRAPRREVFIAIGARIPKTIFIVLSLEAGRIAGG